MSASPPPPGAARAFGAVVPVKPPRVAKSRLAPLGDAARVALAEAFAADTVAALLRCRAVGAVVVVTDDHEVAAALAALGADVVPDGCGEDLNGSLVQGAAELARRRPGLRPAVVCADLPALRPDELARALGAMPADRMGLVADAASEGTTVLTAPTAASLRPRFGPGSHRAHLEEGARAVDLHDIPSVRRDVDTPGHLTDAAALGVGSRTAFVLSAIAGLERPGPASPVPGPLSALAAYGGPMQGTVASYDPGTRSGTVILDDGHELPFPASALEGSRLRLLRPGQRVRLETSHSDAGVVVDRLQILTLA